MKPHALSRILFSAMLCCCLCMQLNSLAQSDQQVELLTTDQGLSQGMIYDILQDREGFIWTATKDGLNRYDGAEFKVFTNNPSDPWSISGNTIIKLFEDSAGRIWAASDNAGLNIYDKRTGKFHHIRHHPQDASSLSGNYVNAIVEDSLGHFICAVDLEQINIFKLNDAFFEQEEAPEVVRVSMPKQQKVALFNSDNTGIDFVELRSITKDAQDRIWIGGNNALFRFDVGSGRLTKAYEGISMVDGFPNEDGSMWMVSAGYTFYHWNGKEVTPFAENYFEPRKAAIDASGDLWLLTADNLIGFDLQGWKKGNNSKTDFERSFYQMAPLSDEKHVAFLNRSLLLDRSGLLWIGSQGYGLKKYNPTKSRFTHRFEGVSVRSIVEGSTDNLYIQEYTSSWYNADGSCFEDVDIDYPNSCFAGDVLVAKEGSIWVRMIDRLHLDSLDHIYTIRQYNPETKQSKIHALSWHQNLMQPMLESRDGTIWLAGYNDVLARIDPPTGNMSSYHRKSGMLLDIDLQGPQKVSEHSSTALYEDSDGVIWMGTERGFTRCVPPKSDEGNLRVVNYTNAVDDPTSLSYDHVTCFLEDPLNPQQYLWVATKGGGLNRLDKLTGKFLRLTKQDGLPDNVVYGILLDDDGNIWGSTNKGLFCLSSTTSEKTPAKASYSFRNFSRADGLQENEFNTGAFAKLSDGRLAFGGINGYNLFDPKEILSEGYTPRTYITKILVNNQEVIPGDSTGILETTIEYSSEIKLSHTDAVLTLEFVSLDFTAPEQNKYRYQLIDGSPSENWVEAGNRHSATFLNLQPNEYTFRVQGSNSQGIWNDQVAELNITVLPPWWKTWWAYLVYTVLGAGAVVLYYQFSINRVKLEQQLSFEKRETDRIRDLDALKTQLYMNMTHEFRTPLTIILGITKQIKEDPRGNIERQLNMVISNGENLLTMVNRMLSLSKLESGKMSLQWVRGDIIRFLRKLVESFRALLEAKEIQLHFLPEVDAEIMDFDADKLQQVISNLLSNAFKFTPDGGNIYIGIRSVNERLLITVKDTGRGIPEADLERIFDRFYQVDNTSTRKYEGSGIGLALTKELVTLMEGEVSAQSPPIGTKKGSIFSVALPIKKMSGVQVLEKSGLSDSPVIRVEDHLASSVMKTLSSGPTKSTELSNKEAVQEFQKPLLLINEDNQDIAAYVASCIDSDYRFVIAENGQEGYELATQLIPDLIITDVMMPIMDGFEFCRKAKADTRTDHIPIVMLTARADFDSKIEGLEIGANAYLPKPFEKQELLLTIKNLFALREKLRHHYKYHGASKAEATDKIGAAPKSKEATKTREHQEPEEENPFVVQVRSFIETVLENGDLSVEELAKEFHLSHSQFGRKLNALTGLSPNKFIRYIRLTRAKEMLRTQEHTVTEVSYACGFNDPSYFTRVFKKEIGVTPNEWSTRQET